MFTVDRGPRSGKRGRSDTWHRYHAHRRCRSRGPGSGSGSLSTAPIPTSYPSAARRPGDRRHGGRNHGTRETARVFRGSVDRGTGRGKPTGCRSSLVRGYQRPRDFAGPMVPVDPFRPSTDTGWPGPIHHTPRSEKFHHCGVFRGYDDPPRVSGSPIGPEIRSSGRLADACCSPGDQANPPKTSGTDQRNSIPGNREYHGVR